MHVRVADVATAGAASHNALPLSEGAVTILSIEHHSEGNLHQLHVGTIMGWSRQNETRRDERPYKYMYVRVQILVYYHVTDDVLVMR